MNTGLSSNCSWNHSTSLFIKTLDWQFKCGNSLLKVSGSIPWPQKSHLLWKSSISWILDPHLISNSAKFLLFYNNFDLYMESVSSQMSLSRGIKAKQENKFFISHKYLPQCKQTKQPIFTLPANPGLFGFCCFFLNEVSCKNKCSVYLWQIKMLFLV